MSLREVQKELEREIQERKYREEKMREQEQKENEFMEQHFRMREIDANISLERAQANMEQDRDMHDAQAKEERSL